MATKKPPLESPSPAEDKKKALETCMAQIERNYGKGSIMRLGENTGIVVESIPTGSLSLDIALGIGALAALNLADLPLIVLPQRMFAGMNGSALLAIPFFILAGNIMSRSITGKLIDICNAIIGHIKGSLSLVTILASALFGAISGSASAAAAATARRAVIFLSLYTLRSGIKIIITFLCKMKTSRFHIICSASFLNSCLHRGSLYTTNDKCNYKCNAK